MSTDNFIVFPNQIFYTPDAIRQVAQFKTVYVVEEPIFFYDAKYRPLRPNKIKLAYMVACMRAYEVFLRNKKINIRYIKYDEADKTLATIDKFTTWPVYDRDLERKYKRSMTQLTDSPYFLLTAAQRAKVKSKNHAGFYNYVRRELNVLVGTKTQDVNNRQSIPKDPSQLPALPVKHKTDSRYYDAAIAYISAHATFKDHIGSCENLRLYPVTPRAAHRALASFISIRLEKFGPYEDSISSRQPILWHSFLSAAINIGLLTPKDVVDAILAVKEKYPIQSIEGFIRQLIGWREYCGYIYTRFYDELIVANKFNARRSIPASWYTATTGLTPLDDQIKSAINLGYAHHIVRLMVFLNYFVLTETAPEQIYKWFMEVVAIDAYDWVMRSNIQMMSHYWPGGMRKPYISSSAYIRRMSDYRQDGTNWTTKWDTAFYDFIAKHKNELTGSAAIYLRHVKS